MGELLRIYSSRLLLSGDATALPWSHLTALGGADEGVRPYIPRARSLT
jgi:hypothetical protein